MEFFKQLYTLLIINDPKEKIEHFRSFYQSYLNGEIIFDHSQKSQIFTKPSYKNFLKIVDAKTMPRRRSLSTTAGKAYMVHNIAHIEYSAIDLALDHTYRYKNMPKEFYNDWLEVADDEVRHFLMLEEILNSYGYKYGDFAVHSFLFDVSMNSLDLISRMATIPRYLEASGLDSNPKMIQKLKNIDDKFSKEIIEALEIILKEEVTHVKKGDFWFKWACKENNINSDKYYDIVENILPGAKKKKPFVNVKDRQKAGFSCREIRVLTDQKCIDQQ